MSWWKNVLKGTFCQQNEESASLTSRSEHLPIVFMQYQQKLNWGPAVLPSEFIPQDGAMKPGELKGFSHTGLEHPQLIRLRF